MLNRSAPRWCWIALVGAAVALSSVHADYSNDAADFDITDSCTDFNVTNGGVMSAKCNTWDSADIVYGTLDHKIDLDDKIGFDAGVLKHGKKDFSALCEDETVSWSATEVNLSATCEGKKVGIRLDDLIANDGRGFGGHRLGLYWRSLAGSTASQ